MFCSHKNQPFLKSPFRNQLEKLPNMEVRLKIVKYHFKYMAFLHR